MTELLARLGVAMGISLVLTLLLLVLYQDDSVQMQTQPSSITVSQAATVSSASQGTP